jgi:curved DNA-binding protein CbpA
MATTWMLDATGGIDYSDEAAADQPETPMEIEVVFEDIAAGDPGTAAQDGTVAQESPVHAGAGAAPGLANEITVRFERLGDLDYYECLELKAGASPSDIKSAYLRAAKSYHPDALARAGLESALRKKANKIFAKISKAYSTLSSSTQRTEYDASRSLDGSPIDAERLANAETLYRKGEILLGLGNFKGALEFLAPAVDLWPDEAEYHSALGWALYKKMPTELDRSRKHLESALRLAPEDATASHRLSFVLRSLGEDTQADAWLRRARQLNPEIT